MTATKTSKIRKSLTAAFSRVTGGPTGPLWTGPGMLVILGERHLGARPVEERWAGYDLPLGSTLTLDEAQRLTREHVGQLFDAQFLLLPDRRLTLAFKHPAVQAWGQQLLARLRAPAPDYPYAKPGEPVTHCDDCHRAFGEDLDGVEDEETGEVYCPACMAGVESDRRAYEELEEQAEVLVRAHLARYGRGRRIQQVIGQDGDWLLDHFRTAIRGVLEAELYGTGDEEHVTGQAADD